MMMMMMRRTTIRALLHFFNSGEFVLFVKLDKDYYYYYYTESILHDDRGVGRAMHASSERPLVFGAENIYPPVLLRSSFLLARHALAYSAT